MSFDRVEIKLGLVGSPTDTPLIHLWRNHAALVCLLLMQRSPHLVTHLYLGCSSNLIVGNRTLSWICGTKLSLLRRRLTTALGDIDLLAVAACLRPPFYLVLDVLGLLFVGLSNR